MLHEDKINAAVLKNILVHDCYDEHNTMTYRLLLVIDNCLRRNYAEFTSELYIPMDVFNENKDIMTFCKTLDITLHLIPNWTFDIQKKYHCQLAPEDKYFILVIGNRGTELLASC